MRLRFHWLQLAAIVVITAGVGLFMFTDTGLGQGTEDLEATGTGPIDSSANNATAADLKAAIESIKHRLQSGRDSGPTEETAAPIQAELEAANKRINELSETLTSLRDERDQLHREMSTLRANESDRALELVNLRDQLDALKLQRDDVLSSAQNFERDVAELTRQLAEAQDKLVVAERDRAALEADHSKEIARLEATIAQSEDALETARTESSNAAAAEARIAELEEELQDMREVTSATIGEIESIGNQLLSSYEDNRKLGAALQQSQADRATLELELAAARNDAGLYAQEASALRIELRKFQAEVLGLETVSEATSNGAAEKSGLEELTLVAATDETSDPAKAVGMQSLANDRPSVTELVEELNARETADGWLVTTPENLTFVSGSDELGPGAEVSLDKVAELLNRFPDSRVKVLGHTDSIGQAEENERVSQLRAEAVRAFLVDNHGIDPDLIEVEGRGEDEPIATNSTSEGRDLNRRVEILVQL